MSTCVYMYVCTCVYVSMFAHVCMQSPFQDIFATAVIFSPSSGNLSAAFCLRSDILGISYKRIMQFVVVTGFLHVEYWCVCVYVSVCLSVVCSHVQVCTRMQSQRATSDMAPPVLFVWTESVIELGFTK